MKLWRLGHDPLHEMQKVCAERPSPEERLGWLEEAHVFFMDADRGDWARQLERLAKVLRAG